MFIKYVEKISGVPKGIRTPVAAVKGQCPRPLDDGDKIYAKIIGGARRDRTADLLHAMQALSQLSYSPNAIYLLNRRRLYVTHLLLSRLVIIFNIFNSFL